MVGIGDIATGGGAITPSFKSSASSSGGNISKSPITFGDFNAPKPFFTTSGENVNGVLMGLFAGGAVITLLLLSKKVKL